MRDKIFNFFFKFMWNEVLNLFVISKFYFQDCCSTKCSQVKISGIHAYIFWEIENNQHLLKILGYAK